MTDEQAMGDVVGMGMADREIARLEQVLAEKDAELKERERVIADLYQYKELYEALCKQANPVFEETVKRKDSAYRELMEKAIKFTEWIDNDQDHYMQIHVVAKEFLNSPEVQAWKEQQK